MLISKDENISESAVCIAAELLRLIKRKKDSKLSIFDVFIELKKSKIVHYRQVIFGLLLLYSVGIIEFKEPYIYVITAN